MRKGNLLESSSGRSVFLLEAGEEALGLGGLADGSSGEVEELVAVGAIDDEKGGEEEEEGEDGE